MKRAVAVLGGVAAAVLLYLALHGTRPAAAVRPAPEFALSSLEGRTVRLSDFRGKVVVLNFWATWCPPCRREMPSMERLSQQLQGEPFVVLAIDQQETPDDVFVFTGQLDPTPHFPILLDRNSAVAPAWGVLGLPTSFIVDKNGRIAYRAMGGREFDHPDIVRTIRELLRK